MAFATSIQSNHFSRLAVKASTADQALPANEAAWKTLFANSTAPGLVHEIANVRDFPSIGNTPNIINVPEYGQKITKQVSAQADAPTMELTLNYVPSTWGAPAPLAAYVGDGITRAFQFALLPQPAASSLGAALTPVPNAVFYFLGTIASHVVNPSRDDASTSTLTISLSSDVMGPFTV